VGSVIERLATHIKGEMILHDDRPVPFPVADKLAGHRLDRRMKYAIIDGKLHTLARWSQPCSGCYESGYDYPNSNDRGMGCRECGHTGRARQAQWVPYFDPAFDDLCNSTP
jgi:hypothetical protein